MNRIYGKPTETVVAQAAPSPHAAVLATMTLQEKLHLLHRLQAGEPVALPVVEPARPTG
jgi:hypothetical protein